MTGEEEHHVYEPDTRPQRPRRLRLVKIRSCTPTGLGRGVEFQLDCSAGRVAFPSMIDEDTADALQAAFGVPNPTDIVGAAVWIGHVGRGGELPDHALPLNAYYFVQPSIVAEGGEPRFRALVTRVRESFTRHQ